MLTGRELYDMYKGHEASFDGLKGIVFGYNTEWGQVICAVTEKRFNNGWLFHQREQEDVIITHRENPQGYFYCTERRISHKS